jgi:ribosome-associated translation inhibitor RaiA
MKRTQIGTLISVVSLVAGVGLANPPDSSSTSASPGTSTETKSTTKTKSPSGTMKTKSHTATGTVKDFEAGKKITVTTAKNKDRSWNLDDKETTYDVDATVAVGQKVVVSEKTDASGHKTVTVAPYKVKKSAMKHKKKSTSTSSAAPSTK